jgi:hypothetical protein
MFFSKLPQNRHPERSASRIYRVTPHLMARSRRTPRMLILPMPFGASQPPKPAYRILLRYPPDGHGYIFSCAVIIFFHPRVCARSLNSGLMVRIRLSFFSRRQPLSCFSRAMAVRIAAENVDIAAGHGKMLAVLVLGPRERPWPGSDRCRLRWFEKLRTA